MLLGQVRLEFVSDGTFWLDGGAHFGVVPRVLWEQIIAPDDLNRVPMALNCLLIESQEKKIVVDTGVGDKVSAKRKEILHLERRKGLLDNLKEKGVEPEEVAVIINTHLHADHCGGNTIERWGRTIPAFPQADYWVQEEEWKAAQHPNERTRAAYLPENFDLLQEKGKLRLIRGDTPVTSEVRCIVTPGHTRSHQSVLIESEGKKALYLGDLAPWAVNIERLAWIPAADVEPLVNIETKRRIREWALEEEVLLIFEHDPHIKAGYLLRVGNELKLEPLI
jgi:glyoxylase-like metal-dependent hydrolase (beta-lactamase superfamily II)